MDFIQTQCVYDMVRFKEWMKQARERGLTEKVYILAGVTPLKSARMAKYMATKVSGIMIPEHMIKRMEGVAKEKAAAEGIKICLETIQELREIPGSITVFISWRSNGKRRLREIVKAAGLFPRP